MNDCVWRCGWCSNERWYKEQPQWCEYCGRAGQWTLIEEPLTADQMLQEQADKPAHEFWRCGYCSETLFFGRLTSPEWCASCGCAGQKWEPVEDADQTVICDTEGNQWIDDQAKKVIKDTMKKPQPTAVTWVYRDPVGQLVPIAVADMKTSHLRNWIQYQRRQVRVRECMPTMPTTMADVMIRSTMITAPAIYFEAKERGLNVATLSDELVPIQYPPELHASPEAIKPPPKKRRRSQPIKLRAVGERRITLDED